MNVAPAAELDGGRILRLAVFVGVCVEVAAKNLVEGVGTYLLVNKFFKYVPSAPAGIEVCTQLGGNSPGL